MVMMPTDYVIPICRRFFRYAVIGNQNTVRAFNLTYQRPDSTPQFCRSLPFFRKFTRDSVMAYPTFSWRWKTRSSGRSGRTQQIVSI